MRDAIELAFQYYENRTKNREIALTNEEQRGFPVHNRHIYR